ncbi:putative Radical SAM protein [Magnetospirillum sp. XM-1]|uniref:quinohemoprotein amine dehydrogenase maturation protein n=1 Tax=Magnetospirillum sp. XM-1 TaxID=1663591 RepID=UPI00073DE707|nr:quinohemoprotein amine dehydrogenase maturation protein [Magnetospirillum sp. XM-1]CUW39599.1 putative Radical SAM protein [Magnetospirillum sp. XM-1]
MNVVKATWRKADADLRDLAVDGRRILFHVPTTSLFELDPVAGAVLDRLDAEDETSALDGRFGAEAVEEALQDLAALEVIRRREAAPRPAARPPLPGHSLTTLVLTLTTGCNLACTYCYKEDLSRPAGAARLSPAHAEQAVELLISESGPRRRLNLTFFGGEPLTALPLIRHTVAYAERRGMETGKEFDYSLTTNATLLDDATVDFLAAHRFAITVSMDGPPAVHDRNRRTIGGAGTYAVVAENARRLLQRYRLRPVGARVTLAAGMTDVAGIHHHLKNEIGFAEVGFAPVTAGLPAGFGLGDDGTRVVFDNLKALALKWRDAAIEGHDIGFSNISQMMTALHEGSTKLIPCGAAVALLAVDTTGALALCHRFAGSGQDGFGHVETGLDHGAVAAFVDRALDRSEGFCGDCHARHLCAGGCYHESYARHGDMFRPTDHYCEMMREWVDLGITIYAGIMAANPTFMARRAGPRGSDS